MAVVNQSIKTKVFLGTLILSVFLIIFSTKFSLKRRATYLTVMEEDIQLKRSSESEITSLEDSSTPLTLMEEDIQLQNSSVSNIDTKDDKKLEEVVTTRAHNSRLKVVMLSTRLLDTFGFSDRLFNGCEFMSCTFKFSNNYNDVVKADVAVIDFYQRALLSRVALAKGVVRPDHPVLITAHDPPSYVNFQWIPSVNNLSGTMTYASESTVRFPFDRSFLLPATWNVQNMKYLDYSRGKTKGAYAYVSNCNSVGYNRLEVMKQLTKYINVDIYGDCTQRKPCNRLNVNCEARLHSKYRFYLAFENSLCKDYITEKFWKTLRSSSHFLPVAIGGLTIDDYRKVAPPKSFIHLYSFPSVDKLGQYLRYLMSDNAAYNSYHQWRHHYGISGAQLEVACDLCKLAHNPTLINSQKPFADDWNNPRNCRVLH